MPAAEPRLLLLALAQSPERVARQRSGSPALCIQCHRQEVSLVLQRELLVAGFHFLVVRGAISLRALGISVGRAFPPSPVDGFPRFRGRGGRSVRGACPLT